MWIALFLLIAFAPACNQKTHEFHRYLNQDFPALTKGVGDAVSLVSQLLSSRDTRPKKAHQMGQKVLPEYRTAINRLREYEGPNATIHNYHQRYLAIAGRQLDAFVMLTERWKQNQSPAPVLGMLTAVRKDMLTWSDEVSAQAKTHAIQLVDPQAESP